MAILLLQRGGIFLTSENRGYFLAFINRFVESITQNNDGSRFADKTRKNWIISMPPSIMVN